MIKCFLGGILLIWSRPSPKIEKKNILKVCFTNRLLCLVAFYKSAREIFIAAWHFKHRILLLKW